MSSGVLSFGYGVAAALALPSLAYGTFGAMVPDARITMGGIFLVCAALAIVPAAIAALGFAVGAKAFKAATDAPMFMRGVIAAAIAVVVFIALVVTGFRGTGLGMLGLLVCVFLFAGVATAFFRRETR